MNFGNFLWAATGTIVGFSESVLKYGAHYHSKFMDTRDTG